MMTGDFRTIMTFLALKRMGSEIMPKAIIQCKGVKETTSVENKYKSKFVKNIMTASTATANW